jgi:hypothetical protein
MTAPTFFPDAPSFRAWLEANSATAEELSLGFRKKATGAPSITWPEARDEDDGAALSPGQGNGGPIICFGWIDGVRQKPETRARRLAILIEDSAAGRKIAGVDIGRKQAGT